MQEKISNVVNKYLAIFEKFADKADYLLPKTHEKFTKLILKEFDDEILQILNYEKYMKKYQKRMYKLLSKCYGKNAQEMYLQRKLEEYEAIEDETTEEEAEEQTDGEQDEAIEENNEAEESETNE
ncbi:MAG: hypothetical protein NC350_05720 [Corallococcus sp.]|nr:hypothetical protein [Corallococcus sp.]